MNISDALRTGTNVTISEALSEGAKVTGLGLLIVFSVLVILMIVLYLFKVIFYKKPSPAPVKAPAPVQTTTVTEAPIDVKHKQDDAELIAVLTAAIAASLNTSTYNLKIKSYKRISSNATSWQKAGISETINNRF